MRRSAPGLIRHGSTTKTASKSTPAVGSSGALSRTISQPTAITGGLEITRGGGAIRHREDAQAHLRRPRWLRFVRGRFAP